MAAVLAVLALVASAAGAVAQEAAVPPPFVPGGAGLVEWLAVLPILLPLAGAALTLALRHKVAWQAPLALGTLGLSALAAVALSAAVARDGVAIVAAGNWVPPFGIVIAVDGLGALLVLVTTLVGLIGLSYARADVDEPSARYGFYTFYCLLIAGVCGAFSTGDIFNLYVWFEVFLISSFGLMVVGGRPVQLDGAVRYGLLNLIATTTFLIAVGGLYGLTGTLNMADIRGVLAAGSEGPVATLAALFVFAFAMKAAAFPLHFWLPGSYHTPKVIVGALFAGLLTKVGVYSLLRVLVMLFGAEGARFLPLVGVLGIATAVLGILGALAQTELRRVAGFIVVSGVGVMLTGIGLGSPDALAGVIVYVVHSMLAMTALFLVLGVLERDGGRSLTAGAGVYGTRALAAGVFLVAGLAAAGLPPFAGFWPKLMLVEAALQETGAFGVAAAVAVILSGFLTTVAIGRIWVLVVLRPAAAATPAGPARRPADAALVVLAALIVGLGLFPQLVVGPAEVGAAGLLAPEPYVERVLGLGGAP